MVYPIMLRIVPHIIKLWVKEANGMANIPKKGPFIIAASHASYMDHMIIGAYFLPFLNQKIHFLAKKEHFDSILKRAWHNYIGAIPIDREKGGREALRWAIEALKKGKIIVIHPEGTRTLTGKLQQGKTGVARLALFSKAPVLPIGLIGTFEMLPKGKCIPKPKKATMNIGKPMFFTQYYNKKPTKKLLREVTTRIMKEIAKLSKQKYNFK